ncbi:MAG: FAD binding domain-containing protein [Pseudomonadota bacterium]
MRPAAFAYHAPQNVDEAVALLAAHGSEARVLAGGQSLVPEMSARLSRPAHVIDLNRLPQMEVPRVVGGRLRVPPLMRHADFEALELDAPLGPLMARLAKSVGPLPVRLRGTMCGAIATGEPAAEWCLLAVTLGAEIVVRSKARGVRTIPAADFFETILTTALADDELIVEVQIPLLSPRKVTGFHKVADRANAYGSALCLAILEQDEEVIGEVRLGIGAVEDVPRRLKGVEAMLVGKRPSRRLFREVAEVAANTVEPIDPTLDERTLRRAAVRRAVADALEETL